MRFGPRVTLDEVRALAMWMTWKCAPLDVPALLAYAEIVVEGANGSTTAAADRILHVGEGVLVVPDVLAGAGGVVVSCFERVQGHQAYGRPADEVDERLGRRMLQRWASVLGTARRGVTLREAAALTAVRRVAEAHTTRDLCP